MERKIFKLFGKILISNKSKGNYVRMNAVSIPLGIYVPEELCYDWLFEELITKDVNVNSTFYQSWKDITSKTRLELAIDQIRHYASTYGTNFEGEAWIPEHSKLPNFPFKDLKILEGITVEQVKEETTKLAYSDIAMSVDTLTIICDIKKEYNIDLNLEEVKNRELKLRLIPMDYKFKNGQECLLWILWKWFGISMLVKNRETLQSIYPESNMKEVLVNNQNILASVFYRNKYVFMRFKACEELRPIINRIRKLAYKFHKPMQKSVWLKLDELTEEEREDLFNKTSIFKLTQMYNVLVSPTGYYVIRNGKAFYKESIERNVDSEIIAHLLLVIVQKIKALGIESVALPKGIELAMPTSEKNFIGEIPLGSQIKCSDKNTMLGIYWKNEWGARDLDLHVRTLSAVSIGWNSRFTSDQEDIIFSGDMTNANPEASEIMWFKNKPQPNIVSVNNYCGSEKYSYDFFIAQESTTNFEKNYMVDPRNIIYQTHIVGNGSDNTLGFFKEDSDETVFVFHSCNIGNGQVPSTYRQKILEHLVNCNYLMLRNILTMAGVEISDNAEIKLMSKGDLINFFKK